MTQKELVIEMAKTCMKKKEVYTRVQLTELFWLSYPMFCAKLLIKSRSKKKTPLDVLKGIIWFDALRIDENKYRR